MNLARFGVMNPVPVNMLMIVLLAAGAAAGLTMTREFFPETQPQSATVTLTYPGATPEEIEESLARKVEDEIADLDEVERIVTTLAEGGGGIVVEFRDGIDDVGEATDEIEQAIDTLMDLPEGAEEIQVAEFEPQLPVIMITLYGEADEAALKTAVRRIRDDLELLPGMGQLVMTGVRDYEIRIDLDGTTLLEHGLSLPQVAEVVRQWMADVPGGTVRTGVGNINVRTMGVQERAAEIRGIPVKATPEGQVLRVGDIAEVREYFEDRQLRTRFRTPEGGGPSASLTVYKVGDQDAVEIAEMARAYTLGRMRAAGDESATFEPEWRDRVLAALNWVRWQTATPGHAVDLILTKRRQAYLLGAESEAPLPPGTRLAVSSDLARFIEGRLDLLIRNARWGALLVFLTLLALLNWRAAFWVGVGLATALAGTLLVMNVTGVTLNLLTMFGLIIVLGLLVDDAIVVAENIQARHERQEPALVAAINGTNQVFWPVVATVLTTIVAFVPLTFLKGQMGALLGALPWVVAAALFMSLVESVLILPSHMGHSLAGRDRRRAGKQPGWPQRFEAWRDRMILERLLPGYARLLALSLRFRYVSFALATAAMIIVVGLVAGGRVGFTFLPTVDSETIIVELKMPIGTPIERTEQYIARVEEFVARQPEVKSVSTLVGVRANIDDTSGITAAGFGTHIAQLFVELLPVEERDRESSEVIASFRDDVLPLDGIDSLSFDEIQAGPAGADITLEVSGRDEEQIDEVVAEVRRLLASMDGVYDIADDKALGQREVRINLKAGAAALGFTVSDVAQQVRGALFGIDAHVFSEREEDIDVRVRIDEQTRRSLQSIENIWLISPAGRRVPLQEIAELTESNSYSTIRRVDRRRAVTVTADTAPGVSPESIVPALVPEFRELERRHPGVDIELSGRQRQLEKATESLHVGFIVACVMIYVILAWLFGSYLQPLAVMLGIPFGTIGVVLGHVVMGYELTFMSLIGFVALSGIVVNDSLILVQFYNGLRDEGQGVQEALVAAGRQRLRAIILTTATTVLGLTPLILEQSFQAKFLIPMAIAIAFGLMSATVLILLVLPCIIAIVDDLKRSAYFLWHGRSIPAREERGVVVETD